MMESEKNEMEFGIWNSGKGSALVPCSISSDNQAF